jgi:hypothetical protein
MQVCIRGPLIGVLPDETSIKASLDLLGPQESHLTRGRKHKDTPNVSGAVGPNLSSIQSNYMMSINKSSTSRYLYTIKVLLCDELLIQSLLCSPEGAKVCHPPFSVLADV